MRLKRWPIEIAATLGAGAGVVLALWSAPDRYSPTMIDLWCACMVALCAGGAAGATTLRNRYLR